MNIFTYGSLMFGPVWSAVVDGTYEKNEARLFGYQRRKVKGELFPALVPAGMDEFVDGILYFGVGAGDRLRLDRFEGGCYAKKTAVCHLPDKASVSAQVYVFRPEYSSIVSEESWSPQWFGKVGIHRFMRSYEGYRRIKTS